VDSSAFYFRGGSLDSNAAKDEQPRHSFSKKNISVIFFIFGKLISYTHKFYT
jgi:hypothetical protein